MKQKRKTPGVSPRHDMPLDDFRRRKRLTLKSFGEQIGASEAAVSRYCLGVMLPERKNFALILAACGGEVTAEELVGAWLMAEGGAPVETPDGPRTIEELYGEYVRARCGAARGRDSSSGAGALSAPKSGTAFVCPFASVN